MDPELRAMFEKVTIGSLSGRAGEKAKEDFKINGQYVDKPGENITLHGVNYPNGVVGIPYFDGYVEKAAIEFLEEAAKDQSKPFFINVNFMKVHQPNLPAPDYEHKSLSKSKYADSVVELDARIGRVMDKLRALGLDKNTLVVYTTDNGAWQDVYPDAGYTPFRGTKGTVREGGNRVPAIAIMPGKIKAGVKNHDIVGGLDLMATFASVAGVKLPEKDREGQPIIFDSFDISPVLFLSRIEDNVGLIHFWVGMAKAPIFAFLIAVIGCLEGFRVQGSAQSVGEHTTSAVVQSIFVVIVVDAIAALFCMEMGW